MLIGSTGACWGGRNYTEATGPRHAATLPSRQPAGTTPSSLRIVTYNVAFARDVDGAVAVLREDPALAGADIILLQEMTAGATARVAEALGMAFVYYPSIHHRRTGQDFGNAVLARWPIVADEKVILPHRSRYAGTQRTATMARVRVGTLDIVTYSTHLGTALDISGRRRLEQLGAIIRHAAAHRCVIIGGDMNMSRLEAATEAGFTWPTASLPRTTRFGRWDHLLLRGPGWAAARTGVARSGLSASDHSAVWAEMPPSSDPAGRGCRDA
jgi:endonuclease/exonuclease/phosphatase family metal-dependent hydrolase